MRKINQEYRRDIFDTLPKGHCNHKNIAVRQEWNSLSKHQRADYLRAVKCLRSKPSVRRGETLAKNRFDDFILAHVDQTLSIHFSGLLLPWHRYFVWLYEKALREECGYQGYQPYWDWSKYVADNQTSTIFDGSRYSFSGNGEEVPHGTINLTVAGGAPPA
ncbi:hypothetical protein G6O67_005164 [Ophiocordyceps sinensis]|uniref:Tyrosinase copper-binding domain-containing protein n=1 Tax=Ophiocordyceps sinensis TaxID=72228 RepID=A0A8H4V5M0_9HYPO|nr:hypothetical protein G6O67_005164 [Ophiocordyceps sinensis]